MTVLNSGLASAWARVALANVTREYPRKLDHLLTGAQEELVPRALHPSFHGSFDWHSAVHGHWCVVRMMRCFPSAAFVDDARRAVGESLTESRIAGEVAFMRPRPAFERPYGLAWLLQLAAELHEWAATDADPVSLAFLEDDA